MHLVLLLINMLMGRLLGFRHRKTPDIDVVYRSLDIGCGIGLTFLLAFCVSGLSNLIDVHIAFPQWFNNILAALCVASAIVIATTWMPFIEHLSLVPPRELTRHGRRAVTLFAKAIPYLYGLCALELGVVFSVMIGLMGGLLVVGIADVLQFKLARISWQVWAGIIGSIGLMTTLYVARVMMMYARTSGDWGLPDWRTFREPGERRSVGAWFFQPLDATIGRVVVWATTPTEKMRSTLAAAQQERTLADYRRFDGDVTDFTVSLCVTSIIVGALSALGAALISWVAPHILTAVNQPPTVSTTSGLPMKPGEFLALFGMIVVFLPLLLGFIALLRTLARRSADAIWARQRWVRWMAHVLDWARVLSYAGVAMLLGAFVAALVVSTMQLPMLVGGSIFVITALLLAWTFLHMPLSEDSYLCTFVANVEAAESSDTGVA